MTFLEIQRQANRVRDLPLECVLRLAGARQDRYDRHKWHTPRGLVSVTGMKFMNWNLQGGGGGAIDLAMHLQQIGFVAAMEWLCLHFPGPDRQQPALSFRPDIRTGRPRCPARDDTKLSRIRRYLMRERGLPLPLLERLIAAGQLYADMRRNAVFTLLGKEKQIVGAELRGTTSISWRGMAPGSRKNDGYFSIAPRQTQAIVLCESAIDAISCFTTHADHLCISSSGARPNPSWIIDLLSLGKQIYCGYDADQTGDAMARAMAEANPSIKRLRPTQKDWNDTLRSRH